MVLVCDPRFWRKIREIFKKIQYLIHYLHGIVSETSLVSKQFQHCLTYRDGDFKRNDGQKGETKYYEETQ